MSGLVLADVSDLLLDINISSPTLVLRDDSTLSLVGDTSPLLDVSDSLLDINQSSASLVDDITISLASLVDDINIPLASLVLGDDSSLSLVGETC